MANEVYRVQSIKSSVLPTAGINVQLICTDYSYNNRNLYGYFLQVHSVALSVLCTKAIAKRSSKTVSNSQNEGKYHTEIHT